MLFCLQYMPTFSASLGHLQQLNCYWNDDRTKPQIQAIYLYFTGIPA